MPVARLVLAWGVTLGVLPYAWGRALAMTALVGRPEPWVAALLVLGLAAVVAFTFHLGAALGPPLSPGGGREGGLREGQTPFSGTLRRWGGWGIGVAWVLVNGVLIVLGAEPLLPWALFLPLFLLGTLWVVWLAWMFYEPMRWQVRWGVLALLLAFLIGDGLLLKIEGLNGAGTRIRVTWRWEDNPLNDPATASVQATVDLTQTTRDDYPQFLGPLRLGVQPSARLARNWDRNPRRVWERRVGPGWGAFAVVGNYAITQEQRDKIECVICYRVPDGEIVWVHEDRARFASTLGGPGPRATPTIAGGRVYTVGATGVLNCLDGATGESLWHVNILDDNDAENIGHGVCGSPLLVGDLVVVSPTGRNKISLAAYHRKTGKRVWRGGKDQASYGSPLLAELGGVRQILLYTSEGVTGHEAATGKVLWSVPWTNSEPVNCSQPIVNAGGPGRVFVSTGYGKGCALFQVRRSGDGSWKWKTLWEKSLMKTKFTTPVLYKGFIYGLDDGILECIDVKTGKKRWKDGRYGHGQILLAGDLLLVQADNGEVVLVEPSPAKLRELGRFRPLTDKTWNNPALAGRYLLVRNARRAACYQLPGRSSE
jgi:outer membrane protein assembly factor BamB